MSIPENPIRRRRESLGLDRSEFAERAGIPLENLQLFEEGGHLVLSLPVAIKIHRLLDQASPERLIEEYDTWRRAAEDATD